MNMPFRTFAIGGAPLRHPNSNSRLTSFSGAALIVLVITVIFLLPSCRAQIKNSEQISSENYALFGSKLKYTKSEIRKSLKSDSDYKIKNDIAVYLIKSGRIEKGAQLLFQIVKQSIQDRIPYMNLTKVLSIAGENDKLLEIYDIMLAGRAVSEDEAYQLAKNLFNDKRDSESYHLMHSLYRMPALIVKNRILYGFWLARYHLEKAEYESALNFYLEILTWDESNSDALFYAGYIYGLGNDYVRAIEYMELAKKFGYNDAILSFHLARCYSGYGKLKEALKTIEAIPENKRNYEISSLHGDILLKINFATDLSPLLRIKKENEKIQLINHWYNTAFGEKKVDEAKSGVQNKKKGKNKPASNIDSAHILNAIHISKKEFLQLY